MLKINRLSNLTWAKQRPPLQRDPGSAALWAEINRLMLVKKPAGRTPAKGKHIRETPPAWQTSSSKPAATSTRPSTGPSALSTLSSKQATRLPAKPPVVPPPTLRNQPATNHRPHPSNLSGTNERDSTGQPKQAGLPAAYPPRFERQNPANPSLASNGQSANNAGTPNSQTGGTLNGKLHPHNRPAQPPKNDSPTGKTQLEKPISSPPASSQPPVSKPTVAQPPVVQPPVGKPPVSQPAVTQPPSAQEPAGKRPVSQPPTGSQADNKPIPGRMNEDKSDGAKPMTSQPTHSKPDPVRPEPSRSSAVNPIFSATNGVDPMKLINGSTNGMIHGASNGNTNGHSSSQNNNGHHNNGHTNGTTPGKSGSPVNGSTYKTPPNDADRTNGSGRDMTSATNTERGAAGHDEQVPRTGKEVGHRPHISPISAWSRPSVPVQIPMEPTAKQPESAAPALTQPPASQKPPLSPNQNAQTDRKTNAEQARPAGTADRVHLGLERLLTRYPDLPTQTAVLGVCDDGLPVLLDLNDPAPGALAVISDEREGQLDLLRTAISSIVSRNAPSTVQYLVFSCQPEQWKTWAKEHGFERFCLAVVNAEDEDLVRVWVLRLADWTEQRRLGQRSGPPVLLIMDTVSFLPRLGYDVRLNFDWMSKEGPAARIWPIATISGELATALGNRLLRAFQSRIMGYSRDASVYMRFAEMDEENASKFGQPGQFAIQLGENWLRFHLPGG